MAAAGTISSGIAKSQQASYQAQIADQNAALDRSAAQDAINRGRIQEVQQYRKNSQIMGQQRANMAANGIETGYGSALQTLDSQALVGQEDASTIRQNSMREAKGFEISAFNQDAQAASSRAASSNAIVSTIFDTGSTLLSGASQTGKIKANQRAGGSGWGTK